MTTDATPEPTALTQRVGENVTTLMFRMGWTQTDAAAAFGMSQPSLSRKRRGTHDWGLWELEAVAAATYVEVGQLLGDLPDFDTWRACRDSNPKPSGLSFPLLSGLWRPSMGPRECPVCDGRRCFMCNEPTAPYYPGPAALDSDSTYSAVVVDLATYRASSRAS